MTSCSSKMNGGSRKRRSSKRCGRKMRGGASAPLQYGDFPGENDVKWAPANPDSGSSAAAALGFKTPLQQVAAASGGQGVNPAMAAKMFSEYSLKGGSRRKRAHGSKRGSYRRPLSASQKQAAAAQQAQAQAQSQAQTGGMFAGFGALLKEALVPLGLLAVQQTYGKGRRTRKNRR
jgi:hypothetical protein